jgi:signal transduction histidine kinase
MFKLVTLLTVAGLTLAAQAPAPKPTLAQAEGLVKKAIAYGKKMGAAKLIDETNQGIFHVGSGSELYISIYNDEGVVKAVGFNTKALVGINGMTLKDKSPEGKLFFKEIVTTAKAKGSGRIDYMWPNPVSNQVGTKTVYFEYWDGLILTAGVYK